MSAFTFDNELAFSHTQTFEEIYLQQESLIENSFSEKIWYDETSINENV